MWRRKISRTSRRLFKTVRGYVAMSETSQRKTHRITQANKRTGWLDIPAVNLKGEIMTKTEKFDALQKAYRLKEKYRASVLNEMTDKGRKGKLWENGKCVDWVHYDKAQEAFYYLLETHLR